MTAEPAPTTTTTTPDVVDAGTPSRHARVPRDTRARDYTAKVVSITGSLRRGALPTEGTCAETLPKPRVRSPLTEDDPSPRCILRDYTESARHHCGEALLLHAGFWALALLPLLLNLLLWAARQATHRTARFWAVTLFVLLIVFLAR